MNNQEAKFILGAYRPSGRDAANPAFADALHQAGADPGLASWFARSRAHDSAVAEKLESIRPPAGLREAILAGAKMSRPEASPFRSVRVALAAAAMLALGIGLTVSMRHRPAAPDRAMAQFALDDMVHGHHGGTGNETAALSHWLATAATPLSTAMPVDFAALKSTGCRTLNFAGHDVIEVCFERNGADYHLYVARLGEAGTNPHGAQYVSDSEGSAATWADGRYAYTLVTAASMGTLKQLI